MTEADGPEDRWTFVIHYRDREFAFGQSTFVATHKVATIRRALGTLLACQDAFAVSVFDGDEPLGVWERRPSSTFSVAWVEAE